MFLFAEIPAASNPSYQYIRLNTYQFHLYQLYVFCISWQRSAISLKLIYIFIKVRLFWAARHTQTPSFNTFPWCEVVKKPISRRILTSILKCCRLLTSWKKRKTTSAGINDCFRLGQQFIKIDGFVFHSKPCLHCGIKFNFWDARNQALRLSIGSAKTNCLFPSLSQDMFKQKLTLMCFLKRVAWTKWFG